MSNIYRIYYECVLKITVYNLNKKITSMQYNG